MSTIQSSWREITSAFFNIGAMAYGGPAIMGIMQAELQERRQWVDKERFLEGLALVSLLPGAGATQLGIYLGHARGGWWGGLLAGLCFVLPALFIMLGLTMAYAAFGATPALRGTLYGLGPVVLGIYAVAVFRLGKTAISGAPQALIAVSAALAMAAGPLGIATVLSLAGGIGILLFASRRHGLAVLATIALVTTLGHSLGEVQVPGADTGVRAGEPAPGMFEIGAFFFKVGAFTFGGGLTMIAFIQEQVVNQFQWLTPREFVDGLALGQFTPGPILMVAAYVGYKLAGISGALAAATAIFLPSFVLMLTLLPMFTRVRTLAWMKAAMRGISPAVIGILAVSLTRMAPHAAPDPFTAAVCVMTVLILLAWQVGAIKLMLGGALAGTLRDRLT